MDSFQEDWFFPEDFGCSEDGHCLLDEPPDSILTMPPPPIPWFWNESVSPCTSMCHLFPSQEADNLLVPSNPSADSMVSVVCASILGLTLGSLLLILVWYKKSKSSSLPPSLPSSSETEYTHPVVNGKSPHSVIINHRGTITYTNMPVTGSLSSTNPWRRTTGFAIDYTHRGLIPGSSVLQTEDDHYAMRESCTSSPVYAELDGKNSISPYAVGMVDNPEEYQRLNRSTYYTHHRLDNNAPNEYTRQTRPAYYTQKANF